LPGFSAGSAAVAAIAGTIARIAQAISRFIIALLLVSCLR
jgi:hypothetical protein